MQVRAIADLVLAQTAMRLAERGIRLEVTEATMAHICEEGCDQARFMTPCLTPCSQHQRSWHMTHTAHHWHRSAQGVVSTRDQGESFNDTRASRYWT